jgi:hypothetical protein
MSVGTVVISNGVQLNNCKTLLFEQSARREESGTDVMFHDFRIAVEGIVVPVSQPVIVTGDGTVGTYGSVSGSSATEVMRQVLALLNEDRRPFSYSMAGESLVALTAAQIPDADNGPKVQHVKIIHFTPQAYRIQFEICCAVSGCSGAILSNRWSCADTVNELQQTIRSWRGRIRVADASVDPHNFRGLALPPIIKGWKRKSMAFTGEPNGLELTYEIVDEEMLGDSPPELAVSMTGTHVENMALIAEQTTTELNIRLDGPPRADKQLLFQQALAILDNRIHFENFVDYNKAVSVFRALSLVDYIGTSSVELRAVVQRFKAEQFQMLGPTTIGGLIWDRLGTPLDMEGYDNTRPILPSAYPTSFANLFSCYLQTPCGPHFMPSGAPVEQQSEPSQEDEQTRTTYNPTLPTIEIPEPKYSQEQQVGMFLHCEIGSEYIDQDNSIQCPSGKDPATAGPSSFDIRIAPPTCMRRIIMELERLGKPPEVYEAKKFTDRHGITHYPKHGSFKLRPVTQTGDGQPLYTADVDILYSLDRVPALAERSMGSLPMFDLQPENLPDTPRDTDQL